MNKRSGCTHQFDGEPHCQPAFVNYYDCYECGVTWSDEWSATCCDKCPSCGTDMEPTDSEEISDCACTYFGKFPTYKRNLTR